MAKTLYCIRNAHNYSSMITTRGFMQINNIKNKWKDLKHVELVITDRDDKSYSTAKGIFPNVPIKSIDFLHSPKFQLSEFQLSEFLYKNDSYLLSEHYKYDKNYYERVSMFYDFLRKRKEVSIAYVGHNRFISSLANNSNKIERCYPYMFELVMKDYCDN